MESRDYTEIKVEIKEKNIYVISLNRTSTANAVSRKMNRELEHAFRQAELNDDVKADILRGEGKHFSRVALRIKPLSGSPTAPVAPPVDSATVPAREAPIEEAPVPTLLRLDADFCLELARELLRSEL